MPLFIKAGFWERARNGYKGWLDLTKAIQDEIPAANPLITNVTYEGLVTLINDGGLTPGAQYKITDFATTHYIVTSGTILDPVPNVGVNEALIVTASSSNTIDKEAKSILYPQDIIHYDWNPANWLEDASFVDTGVIVPGFKGVIYFRHDTLLDNYMGYDFRNVKFRRWAKAVNDLGFDTPYTSLTDTGNGYVDFLTFVEGTDTGTYELSVRSNHFDSFKDNLSYGDSIKSILTNNIFFIGDDPYYFSIYSNSIGVENFNNTIGGDFYNNIIGGFFNTNIIGTGFYNNVINNGFYRNTIDIYFYENNIGNRFNNNTIGNGFNINTISTYFYNNIIGNNFNNNTIDNNVYFTTIGNNFQSNNIRDFFNGSGIDFSLSTHVYAPYNCDLFLTPNGSKKLSYCNDAGVIQVVAANA